MNVLVVYWHPEPQSFNHAMFDRAVTTLTEAGHQVETSDLHAMRFDPVSGRANFLAAKDPDYFKQQVEEMHAAETDGFAPVITTELAKLERCDLMIWQFPLWWFGLPAMMKGWVDRVFAMGRAYGGGRIYETGFFQGKRAMVSMTTGGPRESYLEDGFNGDLDAILRPIHRGMFQFTGFTVLAPHIVWGPARLTDEQRRQELDAYAARLRGIAGEAPLEVGRY